LYHTGFCSHLNNTGNAIYLNNTSNDRIGIKLDDSNLNLRDLIVEIAGASGTTTGIYEASAHNGNDGGTVDRALITVENGVGVETGLRPGTC
jgi:hypothetical protein